MSRDRDRGEGARVYVGDLGSGGSKPELEREFERYGPLKNVWVARNPPGFAFIEFEDFRDAEDAVRDMDGRHVCGVRIKVEMAKKSSKPGYHSNYGRRSGPPSVVSSRYRRTPPPRRRSRSPYRRSRSHSRSPRRSRSRSPGGDRHYRDNRSASPPYRRSPPARDRKSPNNF